MVKVAKPSSAPASTAAQAGAPPTAAAAAAKKVAAKSTANLKENKAPPVVAAPTTEKLGSKAKPASATKAVIAAAAVATKSSSDSAALAEIRLEMDGLEKERDFYFDKLRDIEIMLQEMEDSGKGTDLTKSIFKILYATADGFEQTEDATTKVTLDLQSTKPKFSGAVEGDAVADLDAAVNQKVLDHEEDQEVESENPNEEEDETF